MSRYRFSGRMEPYGTADPNNMPEVTVTLGKIGAVYLSDVHCADTDK
jgi:hypothetical protein